ncbi:uncharacterized protein LOC141600565 [Silene latifolia]|uniref:uncharacterized protein LOC141600565 n=1 Tax=Silene latifolia TaxID=37657 RepID=UPI003D773618
MAKNKRKSMAEDIHLKKLPRIDEDEEFVDTEPLSLPGQPLKFEKKNGLCFIVKKEYVKSRSKFFNRIHIHDSKLLLNQKQDKVNRFAVRVERCNASFLEFFSGPAVFRAVQSKAVALSYSQLLKDIQTAMQSQLAATQHLFKLLTRHMVVRRQKNVCLNEIDKQTADVDGDVNVEDLDLTDPRLISIFREKHQAMINLSRVHISAFSKLKALTSEP